jgi:hypothetical protein
LGLDFDFLAEAVKRFDEDDGLKPAFIAVVEEMSRDLSKKTVNDDYKPYVTARSKIPPELYIVNVNIEQLLTSLA